MSTAAKLRTLITVRVESVQSVVRPVGRATCVARHGEPERLAKSHSFHERPEAGILAHRIDLDGGRHQNQ